MEEFSRTPQLDASHRRVAGFTHLRDALDAFFADHFCEAEEEVERTGGFHGPVRLPQRPWSETLDSLVAEQQSGA